MRLYLSINPSPPPPLVSTLPPSLSPFQSTSLHFLQPCARGVPAASTRRGMEPAFTRRARSCRATDTWPNGCHVARRGGIPTNGESRWPSTDRRRRRAPFNPVDAQGPRSHGGVAQGVAQELMERSCTTRTPAAPHRVVHDYAMPRAARCPKCTSRARTVQTKLKPARSQGRRRGRHRRRRCRPPHERRVDRCPARLANSNMPASPNACGSDPGCQQEPLDDRRRRAWLKLLFLEARTQNGGWPTQVRP